MLREKSSPEPWCLKLSRQSGENQRAVRRADTHGKAGRTGFCVLNAIYAKEQLVIMRFKLAAVFCASIGQNANKAHFLRDEKRQHPVIQKVGSGSGRFGGVELCRRPFLCGPLSSEVSFFFFLQQSLRGRGDVPCPSLHCTLSIGNSPFFSLWMLSRIHFPIRALCT